MDEATYNKLISALNVIQDPNVSNTTRAQCTEYLEEFKKEPSSYDYMLYILNTEHPDHTPLVQFMCLKLIEDWTTLRWNQCDAAEHIAVRNGVLNLLGNVPLYDESPAIRNRYNLLYMNTHEITRHRLAKLLVEIAKREFPQQWGHFLQEMVEEHWAENIVSKSKVTIVSVH